MPRRVYVPIRHIIEGGHTADTCLDCYFCDENRYYDCLISVTCTHPQFPSRQNNTVPVFELNNYCPLQEVTGVPAKTMSEKIDNLSNSELRTMISAMNNQVGLASQQHPDYPVSMEHWYQSLVSEYELRVLTPFWYELKDGMTIYQCCICEKIFAAPEDWACPHCKSGHFVVGFID